MDIGVKEFFREKTYDEDAENQPRVHGVWE
jgi:hypothetical protein